MFKIKFEYSGKKFLIEPYTTGIEKDLLLMDSFDVQSNEVALQILGIDPNEIEKLSEYEKIAILYKFREISIDSELPIKYACKKCGVPNESTIDISDIIVSSNITNGLINDQFKPLTPDNFQDFISVDVDEMELDEYEKLFEETKSTITKFNFIRSSACISCKQLNHMDTSKDVITHLSEDSLIGLYRNYADLVFFGKYTKQDIDTLYPFERVIIIELLNKTREELNK